MSPCLIVAGNIVRLLACSSTWDLPDYWIAQRHLIWQTKNAPFKMMWDRWITTWSVLIIMGLSIEGPFFNIAWPFFKKRIHFLSWKITNTKTYNSVWAEIDLSSKKFNWLDLYCFSSFIKISSESLHLVFVLY